MTKTTLSGTIPSQRLGRSLCLYDTNKIIIHGGVISQQPQHQTFMITIEEDHETQGNDYSGWIVSWWLDLTFFCEEVEAVQHYRYKHTAVIYDDSMFLSGGNDANDNPTEEIWRLDLSKLFLRRWALIFFVENFIWKQCVSPEENPSNFYSIFFNIDGTSLALKGRLLFSTTSFGQYLYIFGGSTSGWDRTYFNDLWVLDLRT